MGGLRGDGDTDPTGGLNTDVLDLHETLANLRELRSQPPRLYGLLTQALNTYEESTRHYLNKVEKDRPWVAEYMWQAVWRFRRTVMQAYWNLEQELREAKMKKDPG